MRKAPAFLEDLRAKYGFNAVFKVDDITMEPHGLFGPPYIYAEGRVIYGFFDVKDKVRVVRRGAGTDAEIKGITRKSAKEKDLVDWEHRGEGGYPAFLTFCEKDLIVAPGDLIVK